jgi:hypothetical protein
VLLLRFQVRHATGTCCEPVGPHLRDAARGSSSSSSSSTLMMQSLHATCGEPVGPHQRDAARSRSSTWMMQKCHTTATCGEPAGPDPTLKVQAAAQICISGHHTLVQVFDIGQPRTSRFRACF